ncbi:MAG: HtaA domain-containing protein [Corynebacterium casei]
MSIKRLVVRRISATLAAAAIAGGTLFAPASISVLPQAQAQTCDETHRAVSDGSLTWGVKESFRNYVEGNIARGAITVKDGASRSGGSVVYPASASSITGDSKGVVRFGGTVNFTGHNGVLDLTLSDIAMHIDGSTAELTADYSSRKFEGMNSHEPGPIETGNDVVFASVNLNSAANFKSNSVNLAGTTTLTSSGVNVFGGFYEAGIQLDNTVGTLSLKDECGPAPEDTGGGTGGGGGSDTNFTGATDSGATEGIAGLVGTLNDTLVEVNGLIVNSGNIMDNSGRLYDRVMGGSGTSGAGTSGSGNTTSGTTGSNTTGSNTTGNTDSNTNSTTGGGTNTTGGTTSGGNSTGGNTTASGTTGGTGGGNTAAAASTAATTGAQSAGASDSSVCQAGDSVGITSAQAQWGVRTSFRNYIAGSIANGGWRLGGVQESGDTFIFSGDSGAVDPGSTSGTILFPGSINFYGHNGTLDTTFSNMEIQFAGNSGQLIVNTVSNDVDGNSKDYGRITLANLNFSSLNVSDSSASGTASTVLTGAGADAFGNFYPEGDPLDDITFEASLGGSASCTEGQGSGGASAGTGAGGGASTASELRASGGSTGTSGGNGTSGSVNDQIEFSEDSGADSAAGGNQFRIKDASVGGQSGISDSTIILLLLAAFVVAGTTVTSFGSRNPN